VAQESRIGCLLRAPRPGLGLDRCVIKFTPHALRLTVRSRHIEVDLPLLGATDVLPGLGELFLGDICI
jgi:hypothetical protein